MQGRQRGFTLLELMVVLMVIGLLLSMVNLASSDNAAQSDTEDFGRQLQAAFTQYRQEAVFQNL
ncbi:MAG TPA: type II secretion system protein GspH, partial [Oceanospirillales bacterium]|nr:type II secretion system protein GspH [Oceanospirillales bacterium]